MNPAQPNAAANLPTRHAREAGANLLNQFPQKDAISS
jgi:hypothetical protein